MSFVEGINVVVSLLDPYYDTFVSIFREDGSDYGESFWRKLYHDKFPSILSKFFNQRIGCIKLIVRV